MTIVFFQKEDNLFMPNIHMKPDIELDESVSASNRDLPLKKV